MELLEREAALQAFAGALHDAAAGRGRAALVRGEAGIGKTALLRHVLTVTCAGTRVLSAGCDDLATARPLGPFRDLAPQVGDDLGGLLRAGAAIDDVFEPLVDELLRPPRPVVLAIDDVHWADQATLDVLAHVLRRLEHLPVLIALTYRSGLDPAHPLRSILGRVAPPQAIHVDLAPLSRQAIAHLGGAEDLETLWRRTHGNPFLATALVRHHDDDTVPPSVQDAVLARIADLDPPERALVELAAVVPSRVETPVLDACRPGWEEHGIRPEQWGLLEVREGAISFRHELARQAVFEALPVARRRQLHRDVLAVLRDAAGDPARLVHHAIGADDIDTLLVAGPDAARAAARMGAHRQALEHYRRLVRHDDRLDPIARARLWDDYASELMTANDTAAAHQAWETTASLYMAAGDVPGHGRALSFLSGMAWVHHEPDESDRLEDEAIRRLEAIPPCAELALAYVRRSGRHMTRWQFDEAVQWGQRALDLAREHGYRMEEAYALNMIGTTQVTRGQLDDGLAALDHSIALATDLHAYNLVSLAYSNAAEALLDVARPDLAAPYLERGRELAERHETAAVGGYLLGVSARLHALRGEWETAEQTARHVWSGGPIVAVNEVVAALGMARALLRRGDSTDNLLAQLATVADKRREIQYLAPVAFLRAESAWLAGTSPPSNLDAVAPRIEATGQGWLIGEMAVWRHRFGMLDEIPCDLPEPFALALAGDPSGASAAWHARGLPYEACMALAASADLTLVREAVESADLLGAVPLAARLRQRLRELGATRIPRGPQPTTRENPAGLTDRQLEVLLHVAAGRTNLEIAEALVVSVRTVDHHVSAALAKLGVASRREAAERAAELGIVPAG